MKMAFLKQFIAWAQTQSSSPVLETSQVFLLYKPIELVKYVKTWVSFYSFAGTR